MSEVKRVDFIYSVTFSITELERSDLCLGVVKLKNFLTEQYKHNMDTDTHEYFQETLDDLLKLVNFKK